LGGRVRFFGSAGQIGLTVSIRARKSSKFLKWVRTVKYTVTVHCFKSCGTGFVSKF